MNWGRLENVRNETFELMQEIRLGNFNRETTCRTILNYLIDLDENTNDAFEGRDKYKWCRQYYYRETMDNDVYLCTIEQNNETIGLRLNNGEQGTFELGPESKSKFVHDLVFKELFNSDTDEAVTLLTNRRNRSEYNWDNQTPDIIYKDGEGMNYKNALVMEFFTNTNRNLTQRDLIRLMEEKMAKYEENLKDIAKYDNKNIYFCVIGVCDKNIICNFNLEDVIGEDYILRMMQIKRTGSNVIDTLTDMGWAISQDEDLLAIHRKTIESFESIEFKWEESERNFNYTEEDYKNWTKEYGHEDELFCKELSKELSKVALEELDDNVRDIDKKIRQNIEEVKEFKKEYSTGNRRRNDDLKTIVNFPLIYPIRRKTLNSFNFASLMINSTINNGELMASIWGKAARAILSDFNFKFEEENEYLSDHDLIELMDEKSVSNMNKIYRNRITIPLTEEERIELAEVGVKAKKVKERGMLTYDIVERLSDKKNPFSLDVDTTDITHYIESYEDFFMANKNTFINEEDDLLRRASELHDDRYTERLMLIKENWDKCILSSICRLISIIGVEICVSLKQFTTGNQFIVKRLNGFDCFLLINPTTPHTNIFFSLCFLKSSFVKVETMGKVFRNLHDIGDFYVSDFLSLNRFRILNWVRCYTSMSNLVVFWNEQNRSEMLKYPDRMFETDEIRKMIKMSFLIHMEDKSETEESLSLLRYICMKGFVCNIFLVRCTELLSKFNTTPRSRFNVWIINKILKEVERLIKMKGYKRNERDDYDGIINPYTGNEITVEQLLNLFYIGYSRNKTKNSEKNAIGKLYKKILDKENLYTEDESTFGANMDFRSREDHRWSISFCRMIIKEGKNYLQQTMGLQWKRKLEEDIIRRCSRMTLDDLATLKASSAFDGSNKKYDTKGPNVYKRKRAIVAIRETLFNKDELKTDVLVTDIMKDTLNLLTSRGWMNIDIFEKMQYSGLREIYVLGIYERIIQSIIESISWVLCSKFPGEAMTNPKNKSEVILNHSKKAYKSFKNPATYCSSDDAAKWNQVHSVTKFCMLLLNFTPRYMHPFIVRSCQLWQRRRVMIDPSIIKLFDRLDVINTTDKVFNDMFLAYKGRVPQRWLKEGNKYLEVSGGFMQGILHYTSSFCHVLYLEWLKRYCISLAVKMNRPNIIIDYVASSDDSSMMISFNNATKLDEFYNTMTAWYMMNLKKQFGYHIGIQESVKSTKCTRELVEFNSRFYYGPNDVNPWIKSVISCNVIGQSSTLVGLQEETNTNVVNILMDGGSNIVSNMAEIYCGCQYYMLLGNNITTNFMRLKYKWLVYPDPSLGFFLLSHPKTTMFGYAFNTYNLLSKTCIGSKYVKLLTTSYTRGERELMMTAKGSINRQYMTTWGNFERLKTMMKTMNLPADWVQKYDADPEKLFIKPRNIEELLMKMAFKVSSPGVAESLATTASGPNAITAAVYIAVFNVFSMQNAFGEPDRDELGNIKIPEFDEKKKVSLLRLIIEEMTEYMNPRPPNDEELNVIRNFYEQSSYYERIMADMEALKDTELVTSMRDRIGKSIVTIIEHEERILNDIYNLCARRWFGKGFFKGSTVYFMQKWDEAKRKITWLKDSFEETLQNSVFLNSVQLVNFLSRIAEKDREIRVSGAPVRSKEKNNYVTYVENNPSTAYRFERRGKESSINYLNDKNRTVFIAKNIVDSPLESRERLDALINFLKTTESINFSTVYNGQKINDLAIIQWVCKNCEINKDKFYSSKLNENNIREDVGYNIKIESSKQVKLSEMIRENGRGVFGYWVRPQTWDPILKEFKGDGIWVGKFGRYKIRINVVNNVLDSIEMDKNWVIQKWGEFMFTLREWLRIMRIDNSASNYESQRLWLDRVLDGELRKNSSKGAIIRESDLSLLSTDGLLFDYARLELRGNHILLKTEMKQKGRFSNSCNFYFNSRDNMVLSSWKNIDILNEAMPNKFINCVISPKPEWDLNDSIEFYISNYRSINTELKKRFYQRFINQSLYRKGYLNYSKMGIQETIIEEADNYYSENLIGEEGIGDYMENILTLATKKIDEDAMNESSLLNKIGEIIDNLEVSMFDDYSGERYNMARAREIEENVEYQGRSVIFDSSLTEIENMIGRDNISRLLKGESIVYNMDQTVRTIVESFFSCFDLKIRTENSLNRTKVDIERLKTILGETKISNMNTEEAMRKLKEKDMEIEKLKKLKEKYNDKETIVEEIPEVKMVVGKRKKIKVSQDKSELEKRMEMLVSNELKDKLDKMINDKVKKSWSKGKMKNVKPFWEIFFRIVDRMLGKIAEKRIQDEEVVAKYFSVIELFHSVSSNNGFEKIIEILKLISGIDYLILSETLMDEYSDEDFDNYISNGGFDFRELDIPNNMVRMKLDEIIDFLETNSTEEEVEEALEMMLDDDE